jgi:hypothetical protein
MTKGNRPTPTSGSGNAQVLARGRASRSNASGRFEQVQVEKFDDGWSGADEAEPERVETSVTAEQAKAILSRNESRTSVSLLDHADRPVPAGQVPLWHFDQKPALLRTDLFRLPPQAGGQLSFFEG